MSDSDTAVIRQVSTASGSHAGPVRNASHGDDELSSGETFVEISDGVRGLAQRVGPIDDGCHLA